jgi:hypothetical protein
MVLPNLETTSELMILSTGRQNDFLNQVTYLKGYQFYLLVVSSSNSNFVFLNFLQSLQPFVSNFINLSITKS